jgi:UDP-GlcNAc:undecaprenyl-phosphate/decaprenyl-phosphate GlcNAc-1-phosphate transferase
MSSGRRGNLSTSFSGAAARRESLHVGPRSAKGAFLRTAAVAFVASTLTGAVATPAVRKLARRWGLLDHALTSRKTHGKPIPRLGGVAIVLAFYAPLLALLFVNSEVGRQFWAYPERAFGLFAGGLAIALLGVFDDLKGANAKTKFLVQFLVAGAMYGVGFRIDVISNPWGEAIQLGWLGLPFTMLWIAGVINALNLIDGLDGLAGGVALIAIATTFAMAALHSQPLMILFTAALAGAVLGFLFYNFNPASIFMGDTGSMFLGFVLAATAIQTNQKSTTAVAIVVPIIALAIPIGDTLLAMARRAARGVPLFSADRGHIHHRLQDLGLSHRGAVLVLYGASILLGGAALAVSYASSTQTTLFLIALSGIAYLALRKLGYLSLAKAQHLLAERKQNLEVRAAVRSVGTRLRSATGISEIWSALRATAEALSASAVAFHLPDLEPLRAGFEALPQTAHRARFGLFPERPGNTHIELGWSDGRTHVSRDTEIAIELVCEHVSAALERIERFNGTVAPLNVANLRR